MQRRRYLSLTGAGIAATLGGCLGGNEPEGASGFGDDDGQRDPTQTTPSEDSQSADGQGDRADPTDATASTAREQARQNIAATLIELATVSDSLYAAGTETRRVFATGFPHLADPSFPSYQRLRDRFARCRRLLGEVNANGPTGMQPATTPLQTVINKQESHVKYYETIASLIDPIAQSPTPDQLVAGLPTISDQRATTMASQADKLTTQYQTLLPSQFDTAAELSPQADLYEAVLSEYASDTAVSEITAGTVAALSPAPHRVMTDFFRIVPSLRRAILTFRDALAGLSTDQFSTSEELFKTSTNHCETVKNSVTETDTTHFPFPLGVVEQREYATAPTPYSGAVCIATELPRASESFQAVIKARRNDADETANTQQLEAESIIESCQVYLPFDGTEAS